MAELLDFILHTNVYLNDFVEHYGTWVYLLLFLIVFAETGFVVTPFLPGDGLLFTVGVIAGTTSGKLDIWLAMLVMGIAAILGNTINYHIGRYFSSKVLEGRKLKYVYERHIAQTHDFFEKHGQKAVILSRFLPIFRTFVPFIAGVSKMDRPKFISYTVIGGVTWVLAFSLGGYFFGNIPWVQKNLSFIVMALIVITIIPVIVAAFSKRPKKAKAKVVNPGEEKKVL